MNKHNLNIQKIQEKLIQKYDNFKKYYKYFPDDRFYTLHDYCDIYLKYFGTRYYTYLGPFWELLRNRGIYYGTDCQLEEILWDMLKTGDYKKFKPKRQGDFNLMNGIQFEVFLAKFFLHCGYSVEKTPVTHDFGADLIIQNYSGRFAVQAKRHKQTVGLKAVQEVSSSIPVYNAYKAKVITTSKYSRDAVKLARVLDVELWDGERLKNELKLNNFRY